MKRSRFFWSLLAGGMVWGAMVLAVRGTEPSAEKLAPAAPNHSVCSGEATARQSKAALAEESPVEQRKAESPSSELPKPESAPWKPGEPLPSISAERTPPEQEQLPLPAPPRSLMKQFMENSQKAEIAIWKALAEPSEADFVDTPLRDLVAYWQQRHKIPICVDRKALEGVEDRPITIHGKATSFRAILEQVLDELDLGWMIRHESLWITTRERADEFLVTRVYAVDHLVSDSADADAERELEKLMEVITETIRPQSWSDVGGPGTIKPLVLRGKKRLVIEQSWPVHLEISEFLEELAQSVAEPTPHRKSPPMPPEPRAEPPSSPNG